MDGRSDLRWSLVVLLALAASGCAAGRNVDESAVDSAASSAAAPEPWQPTQVAGPMSGGMTGMPMPGQPPLPPVASPYLAAAPNVLPAAQPGGVRNPAAEAQALQRIMAELQSLGTIDPAVQQQLLNDLQQTDPALWPMLMQTFRAGMAYRQRANTPTKPQTATAATTGSVTTPSTQASATPGMSLAPPSPTAEPTSAIASATSMLEATAGKLNPSSGGTPGLALPAAALLNAALAQAQRQTTDATSPPPADDDDESAIVPTSALERPFATVGAKPAVTRASYETQSADAAKSNADWQRALNKAVESLESQTQEAPTNSQEVTRHAWLRVLYLAAGRRDEALKPIPGIAAAEQDYWTEQIYALATYLDAEKLTDPARRSAAAAQHLSKATNRLCEAGTLAVKNLAFCTEVSSYGVYQKFKSDEFAPGQALILYAEVENFKSDESSKGFHTALRSSYQILDAQGRRVAENDLALTEEYCQNLRRDYFIRYFLSVPERIYAGKYVLQLTIVDTLSQKIGQSTIDFTVKEK